MLVYDTGQAKQLRSANLVICLPSGRKLQIRARLNHHDQPEPAHLEDLTTGEQVALVIRAEAQVITDVAQFKVSYIDKPEPLHCDEHKKRLIVYVEDLILIFAAGGERM